MIEDGKQIAIQYSVFLEDNTQIDTNVGKDPLVFFFGSHQLLPALEKSLWGLEIGDYRQITLCPDEAYGKINPDAFKKVDASCIPEDLRFEGALLSVSDEQFGEMLISIDSLNENEAILNFNHPLAGKTLKFDVTILDIM